MKITKEQREQVRLKYGGRCAYCGCELQKGWHVDHIKPAWHNWDGEDIKVRLKIEKGKDELDNYNPSCPRCNRWKGTWRVEEFRREISLQLERLERDSAPFRMARDYKLLEIKDIQVEFYFEEYEKE